MEHLKLRFLEMLPIMTGVDQVYGDLGNGCIRQDGRHAP